MNQSAIFTEFTGRLGRFFGLRHWYVWVATAYFLGTWVILWLGDLAGANCFIITVKPIIEGYDVSAIKLVEGYLSQANHGLFYLFVVPAAVCLAGVFLAQIETSLRELRNQKRLTEKGYGWIADTNRKRLRGTLWFLVPLMIAWNVQREWPSIRAAEEEKTFHMGYIQVFSVKKWAERLQTSSELWPMMTKLDSRGLIQETVRNAFANFQIAVKQDWWKKGAVKVAGFGPASAQPPDEEVFGNGGYTLDLAQALKAGAMRFQISAARNRENGSLKLQYAFMMAVQILEGAFHGLAIWLAFKGIFILICIWKMLPGRKDVTTYMKVYCDDPTFRFGLAALHPVYNQLLMIVLLGGASLSLVFVSGGNALPGDKISFTNTVGTLTFLAVVVTAVMSVLTLGPMLAFHLKLRWIQELELEKIDKQLAQQDLDPDEKEKLEKRRKTVQEQSTWPKHDKTFIKALVAAFILTALPVLLPLASAVDFVPRELASLKSFPAILDASARKLSLWLYRNAFPGSS